MALPPAPLTFVQGHRMTTELSVLGGGGGVVPTPLR